MPTASKGFRVTVEDLDNDDQQTMIVQPGDYMLIPFAPCRMTHVQRSVNGRVQIWLQGHNPAGPPRSDDHV